MNNPLYTTPNGKYFVVEQSDVMWQNIFGKTATYFNVHRSEDNFLLFSGLNFESCLEWLFKMSIISKDEMNFQKGKG